MPRTIGDLWEPRTEMNHKQYTSLLCGIAALVALTAGGTVRAEVIPEQALASFGESISEDELDQQTGREGVSFTSENSVNLDGSVSGNSVMNSVTGDNIISDNAFANMNGIGTVVQNSGNNVVIQNSTIVNVNMFE